MLLAHVTFPPLRMDVAAQTEASAVILGTVFCGLKNVSSFGGGPFVRLHSAGNTGNVRIDPMARGRALGIMDWYLVGDSQAEANANCRQSGFVGTILAPIAVPAVYDEESQEKRLWELGAGAGPSSKRLTGWSIFGESASQHHVD